MQEPLLTIGEFSKLAGISIRTIRYYEEVGILKPNKVTCSKYRLYSNDEINKIHHILLLKKFGCSLAEIKEIFLAEDNNNNISKLLISKEATIDEEIERLSITKKVLSSFIKNSETNGFFSTNIMDFLIQINDVKGAYSSMKEIIDNKHVKITVDTTKNSLYVEPKFCLNEEDDSDKYLNKALKYLSKGATAFFDFSKKDKAMFKHYGVNNFEEFCNVKKNLSEQELIFQEDRKSLFSILQDAGIVKIAVKRNDTDEIFQMYDEIPCKVFPDIESAEFWLNEE